jgi:hypothetical protein
MKSMDLQTRKLNAIEFLIGLNDEKIFNKIESIIVENQKHHSLSQNLNPLTVEQLIERANRSNQDYNSGRIKTQEELEKESENW